MIRRRHVLYVEGYDPQGPEGYYEIFKRSWRRFLNIWPLKTDLGAFQTSTPGLKERGVFGPDTHAALTAALRVSGRSPFPIPKPDQMLDAIKLRAESTPWARRTAELRTANDFTDAEFDV